MRLLFMRPVRYDAVILDIISVPVIQRGPANDVGSEEAD